jgi:hypothetical protein
MISGKYTDTYLHFLFAGIVELPPESIKDAEGVGVCSQVFFVGSCQPGAVELGSSFYAKYIYI